MENIIIGSKNSAVICLIDFGMSPSYQTTNSDGQIIHNEEKFLGEFTGNFAFASRNSCSGFNKSRRDDMESLLYLLAFLLNNTLPWIHLSKNIPSIDQRLR
jgi:serine/threonine protein kinase